MTKEEFSREIDKLYNCGDFPPNMDFARRRAAVIRLMMKALQEEGFSAVGIVIVYENFHKDPRPCKSS